MSDKFDKRNYGDRFRADRHRTDRNDATARIQVAIENLKRDTDLSTRHLPADKKVPDMITALKEEGLLIVEGPPGSGKSIILGLSLN